MTSQVVMVAWRTEHWIKVGAGSFLEHFPDERLLVVDNNPEPCAETDWLLSQPQIEYLGPGDNPDQLTHGHGLDRAADWCRRHGCEVMVHVEPDCLVSGTRWRRALERSLEQGNWFAGMHWQSYGPIHPCPGAWRLEHTPYSFTLQPRQPDREHARYLDLLDEDNLRACCTDYEWEQIFRDLWDTAQKNWFHAAQAGRVGLISLVEAPDIRHFWRGRLHGSLEHVLAVCPEAERYLKLTPTAVAG